MEIDVITAEKHLRRTRAPIHASHVTSAPGVYAFFLRDFSALMAFASIRDGIVYVGRSSDLAQREIESHFDSDSTGFSTLRRSLGAILKHSLNLSAASRGSGRSESTARCYRFVKTLMITGSRDRAALYPFAKSRRQTLAGTHVASRAAGQLQYAQYVFPKARCPPHRSYKWWMRPTRREDLFRVGVADDTVRGVRTPHDLDALVDLLLAVLQLVTDRPDNKELDLNPVRLYEHGFQVLDVRLLLKG